MGRWLLLLCIVLAGTATAEQSGDLSSRAEAIASLLDTRKFAAARPRILALRADAERAGDAEGIASAMRLAAVLHLEEERFAEARQAFTQARDLFDKVGDRRQSLKTTIQLGRCLGYQGDHDQATALIMPALDALEALDPDHDDVVWAYEQALHGTRQQAAFAALMARAVKRVATEPAPVSGPACGIWQSYGDERFNAADYVTAHEALTRALACFEARHLPSRAGRVLVSLGRVQRAHGQLETALTYYERAARAQKADGDIPAWLQSLNARAVTYDRLGQHARAERILRQALATARTEKLPRYEIFLQGNLGGSLMVAGKLAAARRELEAAVTRETNPSLKSTRHRQLADVYTELGRLDAAMRHVEAARVAVAKPTFDDHIGNLTGRATVLARQGRLEPAQTALDEALRLIEGARGRVLPGDTNRRGYGDLHQSVFAASIDVAVRRRLHGEALRLAEQARARALLDLMAGRSAAGPGTPPDVAAMQALARRLDTTLLVYWVDQTSTIAWVVTPERVHGQRLPVSDRTLRRLVRTAAGSGHVPGAINAALLGGPSLQPWQALHRHLIAPLQGLLPTRAGSRVTIVPHGPLLHLPFAGLLDARGRYLVERYVLHYAPSLAVLDATTRGGTTTLVGHALVFGDPSPLPRLPGVQVPPALPHAREEARRVARRFPTGVTLAVARQATEAAFREQVAGSQWLHVATHARVAEEATAPSYLLLAQGTGGPEDDGRLTAEEITTLPLAGATVVLSACGTALGRITGEGTLGFTRSFLAAGARAVVATTWEMPDTAGLAMMDAFYAARAAGAGVSAALRTAQLGQLRALRAGRMVRQVGKQSVTLPATPLLWAGYIAVGAP